MLRQTLKYAVARWVPGLVNFAGIALYTRLLSSEDYGRYALVVAWVALANAIGFQWLRSGVRRFLLAYGEERPAFLATTGQAYLRLVLGASGLATLVWWLARDHGAGALVGAGLLLLLLQSWVELNLEIVLAEIRPGRYGAAMLVRSLVSLAGGVGLVLLGFGALGVILGIACGYLAAGIWLAALHWSAPARGGVAQSPMLRELFRYGLPLTLTFGLDFVVNSSDRVLLGWLAGSAAVGGYAASYDLTQQALTALMMTVNLGAFSMAVRALETGGERALQAQLRQHATVLLALALPATVGMVLLAPNLAFVVLGREFRASAEVLIPVIALASFLSGLKGYYFDLAFQLGRATVQLGWASGTAAAANLGLNLLLIPRFGAIGAAYATLLAFAAGLLVSVVLGRRRLHLPTPLREWGGIALATAVMAGAVWSVRDGRGPAALAVQVLVGGGSFAVMVFGLDIGGVRGRLGRVPGGTGG